LTTDLELLQQAQKLDRHAFGVIYDRYYDALYRYIYQHIRHAQTAEDLAAEVFHRLVETFGEGRGPTEHLRGRLYRVAYNLVVDESRRHTVRQHEPLDERLPAGGESVATLAHRSALADQAREALHHLTPRQRSVIVLKFLEGLTNGEIAHTLDISERAVQKLQQRGLDALRGHLVHLGALAEKVV
jgi:RNA polymerase sigma-70 factor (ECF subfamily)